MNKEDKENRITIVFKFLSSIRNLIVSIFFTLTCLWVYNKSTEFFEKIVIIPFLICGIAALIFAIINIVKTFKFSEIFNKLETVFYYLYLIGFSLFWYGFLIFFDYMAYKKGDISLVLFSLIFWIGGTFLIYKKIKERKIK